MKHAPVSPAKAVSRSVGLFGGSFDPPHQAHRALAEAACTQLGLDALVCVPTGQPWQKVDRTLAPANHRLAMLRLLLGSMAGLEIDDRELRRAGPSYTVETLRELHAEQPGTRWWLVIGQDQYERLDTWHEWREILTLAGLAVAARDGRKVRAAAGLAGCQHALRIIDLPALPHSATTVRTRVAAGLDVAALVGAPVARYIAQHHLYGAQAPAPEH